MLRVILLGILIIVVARAFWRIVDGMMEATATRGRRETTQAVKLVRDPVCGTYVPPRAALSLTTGGSTHYFCSEQCLKEFGSRQ